MPDQPSVPGHGAALTRSVFLKRSAGVAASLSFAGMLAACGDSDGTTGSDADTAAKPPARPTGVLRFPLEGATTTFDIAYANLLSDYVVVRSMFDRLVTFDDAYADLVPALATSWEQSDDATEFTFTLREGVTFHDGEPLDATAVKKSFEYLRSAEGAFAGLLLPARFAKLDDSDPLRLHVVSEAPAPDFLRSLTFLGVYSPKALAKGAEALKTSPVGCGAYRFGRRSGANGVVVEAFEDYWGEGPHFERIEFTVIPDAGSRINAVLAGQADLAYRTPPTQLPRVQGNDKVRVVSGPVWSGVYLPLVTNVKPFDDARVRRAVAHAIDKQALLDAVVRGQGTVADSFSPPGIPGYAEPRTTYAFDPEQARRLLADAGADGAKLEICVSTAQYAQPQLAQAIAGQLKDVGIDATVSVVDPVAQNRALFDAAQQRYGAFPTDYTWLTGTPVIQLLGGFNLASRYAGRDLTDLLGKAATTPDGPAREAVFEQLEELNAAQALVIPLFHSTYNDVVAAGVHGYPDKTPKSGYGPDLYPVFRA